MERLRKLSYSIGLLCLASILSTSVAAQDKCSLRVRVLSPAGLPVPADVSVRESDGRIREQDYTGKDVAFCDLGILPVRVTVNLRPGCNSVTVDDVFVSLDRSYLLKVIFDPKDCMPETVPPPEPMCEVLLRVQDSSGNYVPNASVGISTPKVFRAVADRFGRLLVSGNVGVRNAGVVEAAGFDRKEFEFTCTGYDPEEKVIQMQKR